MHKLPEDYEYPDNSINGKTIKIDAMADIYSEAGAGYVNQDPSKKDAPKPAKMKRSKELHVGMVNHPFHYNHHPSGIECIEVVRHMNFNVGNAIKYCWRSGLKEEVAFKTDKAVEDLEKAIFYLKDEIQRLRG